MRTSEDSAIPPGWSYNPSTWPQRVPILILAAIGFVMAMYLAMHQWGWIAHAWDPFFKSPDPKYANGSERILDSWVSRVLPLSDAFLGALGYLADAVTGAIGGTRRWRTMPWIVVIFGIFVGPLGAISVLLVILQPVLFDAWCFLCLCTAAISVIMIGPAIDEMLASLQHLKQAHQRGESFWRAFFGIQPRPSKERLAAS